MILAKKIKRKWFSHIRTNKLARWVRNLDNYLENTEIRPGLPETVGQTLVLSPHPDDESIGCGGTLALLTSRGAKVEVAFLTSGAPKHDHEMRDQRRSEAKAAADVLGLRGLQFLDGQDGELHLQIDLSNAVRQLLEKGKHRFVFCPWPHDGHSDHQAAFKILMRALEGTDYSPEIWLYEVWSPLPANRIVNIDSVIDLKRKAINAHASQIAGIEYTDKFVSLSQYRSLICRPANHAEAFLVGNKDFFRKAFPLNKHRR